MGAASSTHSKARVASASSREDAAAWTMGIWERLANGTVYLWLAVLLGIAVMAIAGVYLTPYDPTAQQPIARLLPPWSTSQRGFHLLGTDTLGRDLLSNMIVGARLTLLIGAVSTLIGAAIGAAIGMVAGYYGGAIDRLSMRLAEAQTAMPMFLVAIFFLAVLGPTVFNLIAILPSLVWPVFARLVRAETLRLRDSLFMEAAIATGCRDRDIIWTHILPNVAPRIAVLFVVEVGHVMLAEAGLSFLGIGVQPPDTTWGLLIARGRPYLAVAWWLAIMPGVLLGLTVFTLNMLSRHYAATRGSAG